MACNSETCGQSGCYRDTEKDELSNGHIPRGTETNEDDSSSSSNICIKCKVNETIAVTNPSVTAGGFSTGDGGRFCADCFRSNLYGKFRFAVTSNAMISPSDKVLVAFSGGPASRVALEFVHEMQQKAQRNFDASERSLPVFGVGVAFVDESAVNLVGTDGFDRAIEDMRLIVSSLAPPTKEFYVAGTESVYSLNCAEGRDRLKLLTNAVSDVTGKEDLVEHLRMLTLQKIALENGYTRLVLGTCTSRIACHVLEATVKGRGYSLAADIQYVDARWEIPVVLPLRDCLKEELNMLCNLDSLTTIEVFNNPPSGINGLVSSFVKLLQEENPSRESTIMRTAGKLTPFHFNKVPELNGRHGQRRQKKYNLKPNESLPPDSYCPICNSPLKKADLRTSDAFGSARENCVLFEAECCSSCQFQILPKQPAQMIDFCSLLPQSIIARAKDISSDNQKWLREQIEDCLLADMEDGT